MFLESGKRKGLVLPQTVKENITISSIDKFQRPLRLDKRAEIATAAEWAKRLNVKAPSLDTQVGTLSGGNQQKVILAKWMLTHPKILLLNDPTKGIDVGAKVEIYKLLEASAKRGWA